MAGLFVRERGLFMFPQNKGRFYHDGRFKTLLDVVNSCDERFNLGTQRQEKQDLVEYLKSCRADSVLNLGERLRCGESTQPQLVLWPMEALQIKCDQWGRLALPGVSF